MQQHVVLEVGLLAEAAVTRLALVRPRSAMYIHVALEVSRSWKRFGTQ